MDNLMATLELCSDTPYINDITQAYLFACCVILIEQLLSLPFSIYDTFSIEERYGFNRTTAGTFIKDEIKKLILLLVMFAIVIPLILWTIAKSGKALIPSLAGISILGVILINLLIPTVILPIFFTFSELEDEELKKNIFAEAEKTKIDVNEIRVIDGSQRSSHSNAFVAGLCGARKVVLFDTLLEEHSEDEILAVVNHELGHVAHNHIIKRVIVMCLQLIIMFSAFSLILGNKEVLLSFGFKYNSNFLYLFLFQYLWIPIQFVTQFFSMYMIRRAEYEADQYAVNFNHGPALKKGLIQIFKRNKAPLVADPCYSALNHSHPTLVERLHAIDKAIKA